jgi:hypothetical protein
MAAVVYLSRRMMARVWRIGLPVLPLLAGVAFAACAAAADPRDLSGVYWATEYHARIQPVGGGELPFTEAGREAYARNMAGLKDGSIEDRARKYCTPDGVPRALATPYPFEIIQSPPGQILIVYEMNHMIRRIAIDAALPPQEELLVEPFYNGHSVGRFEGDTLVVQTAGFKDETFLDATGAPHTDLLETTERIRRISPTELENVVTIHDPDYYSRDWQARFVYTQRTDVRIEDYICGFEHRDLSSVAGVRRGATATGSN